jgi:hypothetical protein
MNKFLTLCNQIQTELSNNLICESVFKSDDIDKHEYFKNVIDDIIDNHKLLLNAQRN